jgi:hypothetical protein
MSTIVLDMRMEDGLFFHSISKLPPGVKLVLMGPIMPHGWGGSWCQVCLTDTVERPGLMEDLVKVYDTEHPSGRSVCKDCLGELPETHEEVELAMDDNSIDVDLEAYQEVHAKDES